MAFIPLFHQVKNQRVLVVGGGKVALRKAHYFVDKGLTLDVLSPFINAELNRLLYDHGGQWFEQEFTENYFTAQQLTQYWCVVAATDNKQVNEQVACLAKSQGILVNVVDNTELCDVILPSLIIEDSLVIAISSSGSSPILSRIIKQQIAHLLPAGYGKLSRFVGQYRVNINHSITDRKTRLAFWRKLLQGDIANCVMSEQVEQAKEKLALALLNPLSFSQQGAISLLSAKVVAADLLTLRALRILQQADVVIYGQQVSAEILALIDKSCQQLSFIDQVESSALLNSQNQDLVIEQAALGKYVVCLTVTEGAIFEQELAVITELVAKRFAIVHVP
ncbi:MAG: siroheme synthase [Colwellia sp.]|nr:siroheme synthase [Colwellia sp.]